MSRKTDISDILNILPGLDFFGSFTSLERTPRLRRLDLAMATGCSPMS